MMKLLIEGEENEDLSCEKFESRGDLPIGPWGEIYHPDALPGEIWITNGGQETFDGIEWKTKRRGVTAYSQHGKVVKSHTPFFPIFGKKYCFEHKNGEIIYTTPMELSRKYNIEFAPIFKMVRGISYKTTGGWKVIPMPNPGSDKALKLSCCCPVFDNCRGKGLGGGLFWINQRCPVHGEKRVASSETRVETRDTGSGG